MKYCALQANRRCSYHYSQPNAVQFFCNIRTSYQLPQQPSILYIPYNSHKAYSTSNTPDIVNNSNTDINENTTTNNVSTIKIIKAKYDSYPPSKQQRTTYKQKNDAPKEPLSLSSHPTTSTNSNISTSTPFGVLLAHTWIPGINPKGMWMSEKLDGVRAYWDGKKLYSRNGLAFPSPHFFTQDFPPDLVLDGELWGARGQFQQIVSIVKCYGSGELWKKLTYQVFDIPSLKKPFEERMEFLRDYFEKHPAKYITLVTHELCRDEKHLQEKLKEVEAHKGEGLMLRQPGSAYVIGRSHYLLKVKSFQDEEAIVIGIEPGGGKHKGRMGALLVKRKNGKKFSIGSGFTDAEREKPPKVGTIVTFRFQGETEGGSPRFPIFVGERTDINWEETSTEENSKTEKAK